MLCYRHEVRTPKNSMDESTRVPRHKVWPNWQWGVVGSAPCRISWQTESRPEGRCCYQDLPFTRKNGILNQIIFSTNGAIHWCHSGPKTGMIREESCRCGWNVVGRLSQFVVKIPPPVNVSLDTFIALIILVVRRCRFYESLTWTISTKVFQYSMKDKHIGRKKLGFHATVDSVRENSITLETNAVYRRYWTEKNDAWWREAPRL